MALTSQPMVVMSVDDGTIQASLPMTNEWLIRKCSRLFQRMAVPVQVYAMTVGEIREQVDRMLLWYQHELSVQEAIRTAKASRRMEKFLDSVEAYLGEDTLQDPFLDTWDQEDSE